MTAHKPNGDWRARREQRRREDAARMEHELRVLSAWQRAGLVSIHAFSATHLRVSSGARVADFFPTTGQVIRNGERYTKRGVRVLLRAIGCNPRPTPEAVREALANGT